jgi:DNA-binding IclR family transcriptional regulator
VRTAETRVGIELKGADRVLAVLRELAEHPNGVRLEQLVRRFDAPKSSLHRALAGLRRAGFADQDEDGRYRLGLDFVRLAFDYYESLDERGLLEPALEALVDRFSETAHYAELVGGEVVYLAKVMPRNHAVQMTSRVGGRNPAHCTGVGKVLLAQTLADEQAVRRYVADYGPLVKRTVHTIVSAPELARELEETRRRGYALDRQESEDGIVCLAYPVFFGSPRAPSGAISVAALAHRMPLEALEASASEIRSLIEEHLGPVIAPSHSHS